MYKFETTSINKDYSKDNLDLYSRGLYDLLGNIFPYGSNFNEDDIMPHCNSKRNDITQSLQILNMFGFIKREDTP